MRVQIAAALAAMEQGAEQLASAYAEYAALVHEAQRQAFQESHHAHLAVAHRLGVDRLNDVLVQRLRALGLEGVLASARRPGEVSEAWVDEFAARAAELATADVGGRR